MRSWHYFLILAGISVVIGLPVLILDPNSYKSAPLFILAVFWIIAAIVSWFAEEW